MTQAQEHDWWLQKRFNHPHLRSMVVKDTLEGAVMFLEEGKPNSLALEKRPT